MAVMQSYFKNASVNSLSHQGFAPVAVRRIRSSVETRAFVDTAVIDSLAGLAAHLPLAYEPIALPCSLQSCGDVVHRSTLDLTLRGEIYGPDWRTALLLASVGGYLFLPPGVFPGAVDYYVLAKLLQGPAYGKDDIILGPKLAAGGFGTVYKGELKQADGTTKPVVIKKATEYGQAEAWMNERMRRIPGKHAAEFITAFDEIDPNDVAASAKKGKLGLAKEGTVWLVWKYEGSNTLSSMMDQREFPYNMEIPLFGRQLRLPKGPQRQAVTIRTAFKQLLEALAAMHLTGIVHRDIKPQNCIVSDDDKKIKVIDLGGAADLRVGINYAPREYLLDPRFAPPQQYVMSTQTPSPPPPLVATLLSPVLWAMETPDRFDMWSCGVTLLQMVFQPLRNDNSLIAFNKRLETLGYDLKKWRAEEESRKGGMKQELVDGFAILDLDEQAGWNLLLELMAYKPRDRCTAAAALQSRFFVEPTAAVQASRSAFSSVTKTINKTLDSEVFSTFAQAATGQDRGALTEAQLRQELGLDDKPDFAPKRARNTIVWWQERQTALRKDIAERKEGSGNSSGIPMKGAKVSSNRNGNNRSPSPPGADVALSNADTGKRAGSANLGGLLSGLAGGLKLSGGWGGGGGGAPSSPVVNAKKAPARGSPDSESAAEESSERQPTLIGQKGGGGGGLRFLDNLLRK